MKRLNSASWEVVLVNVAGVIVAWVILLNRAVLPPSLQQYLSPYALIMFGYVALFAALHLALLHRDICSHSTERVWRASIGCGWVGTGCVVLGLQSLPWHHVYFVLIVVGLAPLIAAVCARAQKPRNEMLRAIRETGKVHDECRISRSRSKYKV